MGDWSFRSLQNRTIRVIEPGFVQGTIFIGGLTDLFIGEAEKTLWALVKEGKSNIFYLCV